MTKSDAFNTKKQYEQEQIFEFEVNKIENKSK